MLQIGMNPDAVDDIAGEIGAQHMNIKDTLNRLRTLDTQLQDSWSGSAKIEFGTTYGNWIQQLENYSDTLSSVQGYLKSVAENYRDLDEAARQAAAGATQS